MSSFGVPDEPARDLYITLMKNDLVHNYMVVAALALWLWDFLITLDAEITYVWKGRGHVMKILYSFVNLLVDFI